jgi:hypothetical protein
MAPNIPENKLPKGLLEAASSGTSVKALLGLTYVSLAKGFSLPSFKNYGYSIVLTF